MNYYFKKPEIDYTDFEADELDLKVKYGLPRRIEFCKKCVMSNQRPASVVEYKHNTESKKVTLKINSDGICDACLMAEKKEGTINWEEREKQLKELCDKHRRNDGSYDCLVPGSGGKDSFYAAHILKTKYNMNPLTVTWAPHIYTDWGWHNMQSWVHAGFDNYLCTPNGKVHRLLTRIALENLFHPFQPFIIGQKSFAPKMASLFNIPLIFYGESGAEYGNPIKTSEKPTKDKEFFSQDLNEDLSFGGVGVKDLGKYFDISKSDLDIYLPEIPQVIMDKRIEFHYLGYYLKWHPQACYYYTCEHSDFRASPERTPGTYSKYNSIDDKIDDLHYYTTYIKFGFGRATHEASQEIRCDDIDRDEGVALVKKFDGEFPERFIDEIFSYLTISKKDFPQASSMFENPEMTRDYFELLTDKFRSPHIWKYINQKWALRNSVR